jgi:poly-beta-1,6-N-acetyl-D-glucosamine synthase
MLSWTSLLIYLLDAAALLYLFMIGIYSFGWFRLRKQSIPVYKTPVTVSVLVAARNEQDNIGVLLQSLQKQYYPSELLEVLIIDDHSDDRTAEIIQQYCAAQPDFPLRRMPSEGRGKKAALNTGLQQAKGELVLITDADCILPATWVQSMAAAYSHSGAQLLLGPVRLLPTKGFFGNLQELEFISLMGSTAGAAGAGLPVMGNGANIGFNRETARALNAFEQQAYTSGDDMFLLMAVRKKFGAGSIKFVFSNEALVETKTEKSLMGFLRQRMRWVSKSRGYRDPFVVVPAMVVFAFNSLLFLTLLAGIYHSLFFFVFAMFILLKFVVDYPLLYLATGFMKRRNLLRFSLLLEFFYPVYVVFTSLAGLLLPFSWKGRRHRK